jgi:FkbM family methyltransferase
MQLMSRPLMSSKVSSVIQTDIHIRNIKEVFDRYPGNTLDTFIDVGAHIGTVGLWAAVNGTRFVYCVEPDQSNFNFLIENIKANKIEHRVLPICMAVSDKSFELRNLYIDESNSGRRSLSSHYNNAKIQLTWTVSLEDLLLPVIKRFDMVDFLKIDVEGEEYTLLSSRKSLDKVLDRVQYIDVECHERVKEEYLAIKDSIPSSAKTIAEYLRSLGFIIEDYGPHYHITARKKAII